jgi:hypothetical protein
LNLPGFHQCPHCGVSVRADVFPAQFRGWQPADKGDAVMQDEAGCFYHPHKKAVVPCAACGRFLCDLCDVDFDGRHICPPCLEAGKEKRKMEKLETRRVLYDNVAIAFAVIPILFIWATIITAPVVLYITVRHWKSPLSIIPRTRARFVIASSIAALQLGGWVALVSFAL